MSVQETPNNDGTDFKAGGRTTFDEDAEDALDVLPERFEKHSHKYQDSNKLILVPDHPWISDGEVKSHLIMSGDIETLKSYNFDFDFITMTSKGVGVKFWFEYQGRSE